MNIIARLKEIGEKIRSFAEDTGVTALVDVKPRPSVEGDYCLVVMLLVPTDEVENAYEVAQAYDDTANFIEEDLSMEAVISTAVPPRIKTISGNNFAVAGFTVALYSEETQKFMKETGDKASAELDDDYGEIEDSTSAYARGELLFD